MEVGEAPGAYASTTSKRLREGLLGALDRAWEHHWNDWAVLTEIDLRAVQLFSYQQKEFTLRRLRIEKPSAKAVTEWTLIVEWPMVF